MGVLVWGFTTTGCFGFMMGESIYLDGKGRRLMLHFGWLRQLGFSFCDIYCWRLRDGCYLYLLVGVRTAWSVEMLGRVLDMFCALGVS